MHLKDTPPSSPFNPRELMMENEDDFFQEDVLEVIEDEDSTTIHLDELDGLDEDSSDEEPRFKPIRDDASCVFQQHTGSVFGCHLEPKTSELAITGAEDDMAYIWKINSGEVVLNCTGHKDSVTCVQFNHDGAYAATGDMSGIVKVWKMSTKSQVFETSIGDLSWLKWHHGTNVVLGGTMAGDVYMWRIPTGECKILPGHGSQATCGVIFPDGKRAAFGYCDGTVKIFDMRAATVLFHIPQPGQPTTDSINYIDCHPDNNLLIYSGVDGRSVVLKSQNGKVACFLEPNNYAQEDESKNVSVEAVGFCKDSSLSLAATGNLDGYLCIWDISKGVLRHKVKQDAGITRLLWVKDSPLLCTAGFDGSIRIYDARNGELKKELLGHSDCVLDIALSSDCNTLLSSSDDKSARIFSLQVPDG